LINSNSSLDNIPSTLHVTSIHHNKHHPTKQNPLAINTSIPIAGVTESGTKHKPGDVENNNPDKVSPRYSAADHDAIDRLKVGDYKI
jgi:hypothetical protein